MKKFIKVLAVLALILVNLYFGFKLYMAGNQEEKAKLLTATIWKLTQEGYKKEDIENIRDGYNPLKGGRFPYQIHIIFNDGTGATDGYVWTKDKTDAINISDIKWEDLKYYD